jgi:hypothetical protein
MSAVVLTPAPVAPQKLTRLDPIRLAVEAEAPDPTDQGWDGRCPMEERRMGIPLTKGGLDEQHPV